MCHDQQKTQGVDLREESIRVNRALNEKMRAQCEALGSAATQIAGRLMSDEEIVAEFFKYHPPTETTLPKFSAINQAAKNLAEVILANCPRGADRSAAIRLLRDARMTANAAIALNGLSLY